MKMRHPDEDNHTREWIQARMRRRWWGIIGAQAKGEHHTTKIIVVKDSCHRYILMYHWLGTKTSMRRQEPPQPQRQERSFTSSRLYQMDQKEMQIQRVKTIPVGYRYPSRHGADLITHRIPMRIRQRAIARCQLTEKTIHAKMVESSAWGTQS